MSTTCTWTEASAISEQARIRSGRRPKKRRQDRIPVHLQEHRPAHRLEHRLKNKRGLLCAWLVGLRVTTEEAIRFPLRALGAIGDRKGEGAYDLFECRR